MLPFDCTDPGVLAMPGPVYDVACTGGSMPIRRSRDLVRWEETGASILPYERPGAPILANDDRFVGPGHGSVVRVGDQHWFLYHAWDAHRIELGRVGMLDRIEWVDGWPRIGDGTPTEADQPPPR